MFADFAAANPAAMPFETIKPTAREALVLRGRKAEDRGVMPISKS
jgi:hypothetical protein